MQVKQFSAYLLFIFLLNTAAFGETTPNPQLNYYGPTKPGETLWKIAHKIRPETGLSYYQVMLALLEKNPNSFLSPCNLNTLKTRTTLRIPSIEEMKQHSHAAASRAFSEQLESWKLLTEHNIAIDCSASEDKTTKALTEESVLVEKLTAPVTVVSPVIETLSAENALAQTDTQANTATLNTSSDTSPPSSKISKEIATVNSGELSSNEKNLFSISYLIKNTTSLIIIGSIFLILLILLTYTIKKKNKQKSSFNNEAISTDTESGNLGIEKRDPSNKLTNKVNIATAGDSAIREHPFGWFLCIIVPLSLYFWMSHKGMDENTIMFVSIVSITLIMWMFTLLPDFIPALFTVLLFLLFGLAPHEIVLSGFSSNGFLLTFSILGLGVVVTSSGLTYRYTLILLKWLPQHTLWYQLALFFTGLLFTPIVPSIAGRAAITAPILKNMTQDLDAETKKKSSNMLYSSGLDGNSFLSAIFLTSAPANLIIFGMLPPQEQQVFQFMHWLYAASLTGLIMLVLYLLVSWAYFRSYRKVNMSKKVVIKELKQMGNMSWREWWALAGIFILAIGIITASIHKIKIPFVAFTVFFILLFLGVLSREDFIKKIDWAFLFLLGCLIGVVGTMNYLEIDKLLLSLLSGLGEYMRHDFQFFILILSGAILGVRLFIPINSSILIFSTALLPLATASGVSPWLVGFIILLMAETSFFNYQSPHIAYFSRVGKGDMELNERSITIFKALLVLVKLIAIYVSIPFWLSIGVL